MSVPDRRKLVDCSHGSLSIRRQCALLGIARSGVYRPPPAANDNDPSVMPRIDELFTAWPFLGSRRMTTSASRGPCHQSQAGAAVDAQNGHRGAWAEAAHHEVGAGGIRYSRIFCAA